MEVVDVSCLSCSGKLHKALENVFSNHEKLHEYSWEVLQNLLELCEANREKEIGLVLDYYFTRLIVECSARELFLFTMQCFEVYQKSQWKQIILLVPKIVQRITRRTESFQLDAIEKTRSIFSSLWRQAMENGNEMDSKEPLSIIDPSKDLEKAEQRLQRAIEDTLWLESAFVSFILSFMDGLSGHRVWDNSVLEGTLGIALDLLEYASYRSIDSQPLILFLKNIIESVVPPVELLMYSVSTEALLEENEFHPFIHRNSRALGCYWYHSLVTFSKIQAIESVVSPSFIFTGCAVHIHSLLQAGIPVVVSCGTSLLQRTLDTVPQHSIHLPREIISEGHIYVLLFQELFNNMSKHPVKEARQELYHCFRHLLDCFSESSQFFILSLLIEKCPYVSMKGELIHQLKDCIHRLSKLLPDAPARKLVFQTHQLYKTLKRLQNDPKKPIEQLDHVVNYLNLIRFMLLLDNNRGQGKESLLSSDFVNCLQKTYLEIQILHANQALQQNLINLDTPALANQAREALQVMAAEQIGASSLSPSDFSSGTMRSVTDLELVIDLTKRVIELTK